MNTGVKCDYGGNNHEKVEGFIIQQIRRYCHTVRFQNEKDKYKMYGNQLQCSFYFPQFTGNHGDAFILHDSPQKRHQYVPEGNKYDHPEFYGCI